MTGFEGIALSKELVGFITAIGIVPTILIMSVSFFFFFREIKKQINSLESSLSKHKEHTLEQDKQILALIKQNSDEIRYIEKSYIEKEQHYRDFEGWKSEIQNVSKLLIDIYKIIGNGG